MHWEKIYSQVPSCLDHVSFHEIFLFAVCLIACGFCWSQFQAQGDESTEESQQWHLLSCISCSDELESLIRSWLQHTRPEHMCGNFPNNPSRAAVHLQGDVLLRPWFLLSTVTNLELTPSCRSIFIRLLNGPRQAYLNLSLNVSEALSDPWHRFFSYSSLGKLHRKKPDWKSIFFSLCPFSLDLIHTLESIPHCCLRSHLVILGLLWFKFRRGALMLQQETGAFIWCKFEPKLWLSRGVLAHKCPNL